MSPVCTSLKIPMADHGPNTAASDPPLIERYPDSDSVDFRAIYQAHAPMVYRLCCRLLRDAADAEDVTQLVFLQAHRSLSKFEGRSSMSTWLCGIAVRLAANHRRGAARRARATARAVSSGSTAASDASASSGASRMIAQLDARAELLRLRAAVDKLDEHKRTVFILHHLEGLALTDVAQIMAASVQTTFARAKAARAQLAAILAQGEEQVTP